MDTLAVTDIKTVNIQLPASEFNLLKTLAKKMGWVATTVKTNQTEEPNEVTKAAIAEAQKDIEAIKQGEMTIDAIDTSNVDAMLKSCGSHSDLF